MPHKKQGILNAVPLAYALRLSLKHGYSLAMAKHDATAALIVSLVALPLAMALSIAVGLPPQNGLYTAIVAGIIVPLLGGSLWQVTGPTAAFVVIVAPIVSQHGLHGLIVTEILAGFVLILAGIFRLGRYIHYVPYPVTTGFTSGIAVVIGTLALNDFLGLGIRHFEGDYIQKVGLIFGAIPNLYWPDALTGVVSLCAMSVAPYVIRKVPSVVVGVCTGTLLAYALKRHGFDVATLGSRFTFTAADGSLGHGIPPFPPMLHWPVTDKTSLFAWPGYDELKTLMVPALVVAALAALESLLSATVADGLAGTRHQSNAELVAVGIGNVFSGLAMGIPATGAIARTATNIHGGAKTPLAASLHAALILLYVVLLAPFISYIPMASLAALLITVAFRMSHYRQFFRTIQIAPRSDTAVLLVCFLLTVFVDMVAGVTAGVVLACFLFIQRIAGLTEANVSGGSADRHFGHLKLPEDVLIYRISGSIFFGTAERTIDSAEFIKDHIRTLIIDLQNVPLIDMTGLVAMKNMILDMFAKDRRIILCGKPEVTGKILLKLPLHARGKVEVANDVESAVGMPQAHSVTGT